MNFDFKGSLPDSLEMRYIQKQFSDKFFTVKREIINRYGKKEINYLTRTNAIIDVAFTDDYKKVLNTPATIYRGKNKDSNIKELITLEKSYGNVILKQADIYNQFYSDGFNLNGIHYVLFKRSTSKSRQAQTLFIDESMLDDILLWSRMDLKFKENEPCDVASLMAYESLTFSGIIGDIRIEPNEILLIDDVKSYFTSRASVTEYNEKLKRLVVEEREEPQDSDIFDGQSLLDASKFTGEFENKGCLLLRNKFFKSCAFNCNIQQFFREHNIIDISQLKGITTAKSVTDIKLITTPNSLKALKFAYKLQEINDYSAIANINKDELVKCPQYMFDYWIKHTSSDFGVCKYEKPSSFGERNQLSYQMLNSLPLSYDEVLNIAEYNINQINNINNDFESFKEFINVGDEIGITREMLYNLCCINPDIQHTKLYKDKRSDIVKSLKLDMLKGRLLVNGDYAIMVSNPLEMLKCACGIEWADSLHQPYEIYSPIFGDGVELVGFRNPHVASGNVCVFTNKYIDEITKYMNLTRNIVVINSYKNDVLARLQGADMDSDSCLLVNNDVILKAGKECLNFATPLNKIKGEKQQRKYNKTDIAKVDNIIGENMIGRIINLSQLFNSYYWDYKYKGASDKQLQTIYNCVSILSSMSQMEIDKAKKFFTLNVKSELKKIINTVFNPQELDLLNNERKYLSGKKNRLKNKLENDMSYQDEFNLVCDKLEENQKQKLAFIEKNRIIKLSDVPLQKVLLQADEIKTIQAYNDDLNDGVIDKQEYDYLFKDLLSYEKTKQEKPSFFQNNSRDKNCNFKQFNTPMDYLTDIVSTKVKKAKPDKKPMNLTELLPKLNTACADRRQINNIQQIVSQVSDELNFCYMASSGISVDGKFDYKRYKESKKVIMSDGITTMQKVKISKIETMLLLIKRCYSDKSNLRNKGACKHRTILCSLLYKSHTELFLKAFCNFQ